MNFRARPGALSTDRKDGTAMSRIAVVTDTNSSMTREEAKKLGVYLLPMPFIVDGKEYFEGVTCTYEQFFEMLAGGADVSTSQPSPGAVLEMWDRALETNDELLYIPMSSALSGSCATARSLAEDYDGRVTVVDNQRISATQRQSVFDAVELLRRGYTAAETAASRSSEQQTARSTFLPDFMGRTSRIPPPDERARGEVLL